jgi:hypothetical protein
VDNSKRKEEIAKKARELARSGTCDGFLRIVLRLRNAGYSKALFLLDNMQMGEELNSICKFAQSETESRYRSLYSEWVDNIGDPLGRIIADMNVLAGLHEGILEFFDVGFLVAIKRKFNSDELQAHIEIAVNSGRSIGFSPPIDLGVFLSDLNSDDQSYDVINRAILTAMNYRDVVGKDFCR